MEKNDYLSLPIKYEINNDDNSDFDSERFMKIKLWVMHDKLNLNNSYFDNSDIEKAKRTLKNVPILGFVQKQDGTDASDFTGHEIEYKVVENDIETIYLERPLGLIPEFNNYHYETYDNKEFVVVDGFLWKTYMNDALGILERDETKSCSMEISIDKGEFRKGESFYRIIDYKYLGVTLLGDSIKAGMQGAHIDVVDNYETFNNQYFSMIEELKENLKVNTNLNINTVSEFNLDADNIQNNKKEDDGMIKTKKEIAELFTLTVLQLMDEIDRVISEFQFETEDWWGDTVSRSRFYLRDFDDSFVYCVDRSQDYIDVKMPYVKDNDSVVVDFTNPVRIKYSPVDWIEGTNVENETENFAKKLETELKESFTAKYEEKLNAKVDEKISVVIAEKEVEFKAKITDLETTNSTLQTNFTNTETELNIIRGKYSVLETENESLKEFKTTKISDEKKSEVENLFARKEFGVLTAEDYLELKTEALDMEISDVENKLFALLGKKIASKFSLETEVDKTKENNEIIKMSLNNNEHEETSSKPYANIIKKYSNKK